MKKSLTGKDGEVRPLTEKELQSFKPGKEVMPPEFFEGMKELRAKRLRGRPHTGKKGGH